MRVEAWLDGVGRAAIKSAVEIDAAPLARRAQDPSHGDYQMNGALPLAKQLRLPPRDVATKIAKALEARSEFASVTVAGPGFINLRLKDEWLADTLSTIAADPVREGVPTIEKPERIVVDYSGPNIAKQMHVGHIRSTILGDALARMLSFVGHDVVRDNHVGDWGTQYGLLIAGLRAEGIDAREIDLARLEEVYRNATERAKADSAFADEARRELAKLQMGDEANRAIWSAMVATTWKSLDEIYARLDVKFDTTLGESTFEPALPGVVDDLLARGIAREDQGAICVFFEDDPQLSKVETPFIVRKKDGAFLYSTTDIATINHRRDKERADTVIYVVDARQALHFKQLFAVARKLGITMRLEHVGFGAILGSDGRPLKTREGRPIALKQLLDEAETRAKARIAEEGLEVPPDDLERVARIVGIGAVKYADLRQNRASDYQFDWDKMISFRGNAGPYLQYAYARIRQIFAKGGVTEIPRADSIVITAPEERALAIELARFGDVVFAATAELHPHVLCDHLYEVSRRFSGFYEACPVLKADEKIRASRLAICDVTARQLARGLSLLGIGVVERM